MLLNDCNNPPVYIQKTRVNAVDPYCFLDMYKRP